MPNEHSEFINDLCQKINNWLQSEVGKANRWKEYIRYTPDLFHLLIKLSTDKEVVLENKARIAAAISYFISPIDLIPERFYGAHGFVDDIALAAYVLQDVDDENLKKYWQSEIDVTQLIGEVVANAEAMVGEKIWKELKKLADVEK